MMKQGRTWRYGLALAAIFVALFSAPAFSDPFRVVAVKSADIKPYNDVIDAYRRECNCEVTELTILGHENNIVKTVKDKSPRFVLAVGTDAFRKVKTIKEVPVIYTFISTAEEYVPIGTNISGVSMEISPANYIDTIRTLFPDRKRVSLLYDPENSGRFVRDLERTAVSKELAITSLVVRKQNEVQPLLESLKSADVFMMLPDTTVLNSENINAIFLFSFRNKIPVVTFSRKFVDMGAAAGLFIDPALTGRQAAQITRRLLNQVSPAPIKERSNVSTLLINRKILKKMGISIPDGALNNAETID